MNINEEVNRYISKGYSNEQANARLIQDVILSKISKSYLKDNITIKGGVVMFNLTKKMRRATIDIDLDFIRYSISDESIKNFFDILNNINDGIVLSICYPIIELKQQDYKGKRIRFYIRDTFGHEITNGKINIGVHTDVSITQNEFTFQIESYDEKIVLHVNSKEQIFAEKLSSLLKHGVRSTRYKDIYDLYYLITEANINLKDVMLIVEKMKIYQTYSDVDRIRAQLDTILHNNIFSRNASQPHNDWIEVDYLTVINVILDFLTLSTVEK